MASKLQGRVVVVGVGDAAHGDDGVGPMVAGLLAEMGVDPVIDSGASPELDTWRIRELDPDTVLFVDAVDLGSAAGAMALLAPADLRSSGFDTHRAPIKLTMEYLESELGCQCYLLGIQPVDVRNGAKMCSDVERSARDAAALLWRNAKSELTRSAG